MFLLRSLLIAVISWSPVLAIPTLGKRAEVIELGRIPSRGRPAGAAYFITNEPSGNYVVVASISSYGRLSYNRAVSTRGLGGRGNNPTGNNVPDALFSSGSVVVSRSNQVLAVVNSGSDTISTFAVDARNPTNIQHIGQPISSEGEFPVSLAFNTDGSRLCTLNAGKVNGVHCYSVSHTDGLAPLQGTLRYIGYNQTTPPTGPAGTASQIAFSDDQKKLLVLVKGIAPAAGYLLAWDIAKDGSLSKEYARLNLNPASAAPFSMNRIQGKDAILATAPGVGFGIYDFSNAKAGSNTPTGPQSSLVPIQGEMGSCWSSRSDRYGNYYLADLPGAVITEVKVDHNLAGSVVGRYPLPPLSSAVDVDIASLLWADYLYVLQANITSIGVMALAGQGKARTIGSFDLAGPAKAAGLTISLSHLSGMATFVAA